MENLICNNGNNRELVLYFRNNIYRTILIIIGTFAKFILLNQYYL